MTRCYIAIGKWVVEIRVKQEAVLVADAVMPKTVRCSGVVAVPPDALVLMPQLEPLPGETQAQYLARVAAGSVMVRNVEVSDG